MKRIALISLTLLATAACGSQTTEQPSPSQALAAQLEQPAPATQQPAVEGQPAPTTTPLPEVSPEPTPAPSATSEPSPTPSPSPTPCQQVDAATGNPNYLCGTWASGSLISTSAACSHFHGALFMATKQADGTYLNGHFPLTYDAASGDVSWQADLGTIYFEVGSRGVWVPDQHIPSQAFALPCYFDVYPAGI